MNSKTRHTRARVRGATGDGDLHQYKGRLGLTKYLQVHTKQNVLGKAFLGLYSLMEVSMQELGESLWEGDWRGSKGPACVFLPCASTQQSGGLLFGNMCICVAHRGIDFGLLNGILSNLWVILRQLSHKSVPSFVDSPHHLVSNVLSHTDIYPAGKEARSYAL